MIKTDKSNKFFPRKLNRQHTFSQKEIEQEQTKLKTFRERCQPIFEMLKPQFIETHYNWYLAIEPDSGEYFLAENDLEAGEYCRQKYPNAIPFVFRLNETGVCGTI